MLVEEAHVDNEHAEEQVESEHDIEEQDGVVVLEEVVVVNPHSHPTKVRSSKDEDSVCCESSFTLD